MVYYGFMSLNLDVDFNLDLDLDCADSSDQLGRYHVTSCDVVTAAAAVVVVWN